MKAVHYLIKSILLVAITAGIASCEKNENIDLVAPSYKTFSISSGGSLEIPVITDNWVIEFVEDASSNQKLQDKDGNLLELKSEGKTEASNGWLALTREKADRFTVNLKENFDKSTERKFIICINSAGIRDYIEVTQKAGKGYKIVETVFTEIDAERKIYTSNEGCERFTFTNHSSESIWKRYDDVVYGKALESSEFESNDYGAFEWVPEEGIKIAVPELIINDQMIGSTNNLCTYQKGVVTTPLIRGESHAKILVEPRSTINITGEISYSKSVYNYTFTIENIETGVQFEIKGIFRKTTVISTHSTFS